MKANLTFVFPGQGSQSVGMLAEVACQHALIGETFNEAADVLGFDLWQMVQQGPDTELNRTEHTQAAILTASVALWRLWLQEKGVLPGLMAGHSLGEYSALVCAQSLAFTDAVKLVYQRGQYMQQASPAGSGGMAAILGLEDEIIRQLCYDHRQQTSINSIVAPANFNSPGQVVISGHLPAVQQVMSAAKASGARKTVLLPVSVPSHCALMKPAAKRLEDALNAINIRPPQIPIIHNLDVQPHTEPEEIRMALLKQLYSPVRWSEIITYCSDKGCELVVECGPGKVLSALNRRINRGLKSMPYHKQTDLEQVLSVTGAQ